MALIKCPECGKEISSMAKACPNCGCPVAEMKSGGTVKIKMPNINLGIIGIFSSRRATVETINGKVLWEGQHGQTAVFKIQEPLYVTIDLGIWANDFRGKIEPRKKYNCIQDTGIHLNATYRLSEVDVIDSD